MLDSVTKKRIDALRNILVGKIPSPQSQVEQITTGLIYKFMYDMDNEAIEMGGVPSFFIDEYEKYSWKHLFNTKLGGVAKVKLYCDAIENLYTNPNAPSIFREIFKNSFLPFKDPSTLNMFLKEINEFHYSNSEQLGDAYEYLLSFMGSQGDAGQFRTPRHIIDFIIQIVDPQKNETILDPACGTSGFLISSYKHILTQNTQTRIGDKLNALERKQIGDNLVGYDIDPAMSRISLVNMYLHNFTSPNISEYDTLSSEDKWNEYFDVILANPPFFSPKGGIKPHSRFGMRSTRAEVLFVDYIMEHLKPEGRAGIIVPEGIIFERKTAYKILRKKLVEDYLVGVISLPTGIFKPYSGVKTSILILDKELNQKSKNVFFAKIENDGFSLGATRTPIDKNDLPEIKECIKNKDFTHPQIIEVQKQEILSMPDMSFSFSKYAEKFTYNKGNFNLIKLRDLLDIQSGAREKGGAKSNGIPSIGGGQIDLNGNIKSEKMVYISSEFYETLGNGKLEEGDVLIVKDGATTGKVGIFNSQFPKAAVNEHVFLLRCNETLNSKYLFYLLRTQTFQKILKPYIQGIIGGINLSIKDIKIPVPQIEFQREIVDELENYEELINGCRQITEKYKPSFEIDPSWEIVELGEISEVTMGQSPPGDTYNTEGHGLPLINGPVEFGKDPFSRTIKRQYTTSPTKVCKEGDLIVCVRGSTTGRMNISGFESCIGRGVASIRSFENQSWINYVINSYREKLYSLGVGSTFPNISKEILIHLKIPLPPPDIQSQIIKSLDQEMRVIEGNKFLIERFIKKINDKINQVWNT